MKSVTISPCTMYIALYRVQYWCEDKMKSRTYVINGMLVVSVTRSMFVKCVVRNSDLY